MASYYDPAKRDQTLPSSLLERVGEGLRAANRAVATKLENIWYPRREEARERELDAAVEQERRNILANDAQRAQAEKAKRVAGIQTETSAFGPDGNLVVTEGGKAGDPGVLSYYAPTTAKFSQTGNTGRVDFGQGVNYAEFDTNTPNGKAAAARFQELLANPDKAPVEYRQGRKYLDSRGAASPYQNDMEARMYAAQGGGNNFAADPQGTLRARLASYAAASDLVNQTRAEARGLDPRLAGVLDKYKPSTLRAASASMKQQPQADEQSFREQMMLEQAKATRGGLGKAAQPAKVEDVYKANLDMAKGLLPDAEAKAFAAHVQAKGFVFKNQAEVAAAIKEWRAGITPEAGYVPGDGPFDYRKVNANVSWSWNPFGSDYVEYLTPGGQVVKEKVSRERALRAEQELKQRQAQ